MKDKKDCGADEREPRRAREQVGKKKNEVNKKDGHWKRGSRNASEWF